jgi:succinyl-diaminopimelate desuccinylase
MSDTRQALLKRIDADRDRLVGFLQAFTRIDTANPPGDTRAGAAFIGDFLDRGGLSYHRIAPQETMPNLVAATRFARPGRHLVLNGHIDVFPSGDPARWTHAPLSGAIVDGRVHGLGTVDMKCGTTASIFTYAYLSGLADEMRGAMTLTLVSDEETGGRWGSGYLVEHHADEVLGDCVLNGEPSSPHTIRFGEKAMFWMKFSIRTPGGHSAYPHVSKSANRIAAALIRDLESLESLAPAAPEKVARALGGSDVLAGAERGLGAGAGAFLQKVTLNIGVMRGGVKVNMLPASCEIEADARLPVGVDREDVRRAVEHIVARYPEVSWEEGASQRGTPRGRTPSTRWSATSKTTSRRCSASDRPPSSRWAAPIAASGARPARPPTCTDAHRRAWARPTNPSRSTSSSTWSGRTRSPPSTT